MWVWVAVPLTLIVAVSLAILIRHRIRREMVLSVLASQRAEWVRKHPLTFTATADLTACGALFDREKIVRIEQFLDPACLQLLRGEAEYNIPRMVPSYIPTHKKGKTLSYENIHRHAHGCLALYHSNELQELVSRVVGLKVVPTPDRDQSSLSVLCYNELGDHINWHYDHNFYQGRHFTVLLSLANESSAGELSQSQLMRRTDAGDETFDTSPNSLVIFEGARVLHRASPTAAGDLRIMLSMTYTADPRTSWPKEIGRRIKETAFYGIRALWD